MCESLLNYGQKLRKGVNFIVRKPANHYTVSLSGYVTNPCESKNFHEKFTCCKVDKSKKQPWLIKVRQTARRETGLALKTIKSQDLNWKSSFGYNDEWINERKIYTRLYLEKSDQKKQEKIEKTAKTLIFLKTKNLKICSHKWLNVLKWDIVPLPSAPFSDLSQVNISKL